MKKLGWALLFVVVLLGASLLIFFGTNNRYHFAYRSFKGLKEASSMTLAYESKIGMGSNQVGIQGETRMTTSPKVSAITVHGQLGFLGTPKLMDIYIQEGAIYYKYNLGFLPWQKGEPHLEEDAFNPSNIPAMGQNIQFFPLLRFAKELEKEDLGQEMRYYTTSLFTEEEFKGFLGEVLKLKEAQLAALDIDAYEIALIFTKETNMIKVFEVTFDHRVRGIALHSSFRLELLGLNDVGVITTPEGLPD